MDGHGYGFRAKRRKNIFLVILIIFISFPLLLVIFNNVLFGVEYDGQTPLDDDHIAQWTADDPRLIEHIRKNYLFPPAPKEQDYNLLFPTKKDWSHKGQSMIVDDILGGRRNGFFFEAGGYDGETYSNTLYFEKYLNWTGILVEPDWANIKRLRSKNRKSWVLQGCVEGGNKPEKLKLYGAMETGTLDKYMTPVRKVLTMLWRPTKVTEVWCFPLSSILLAVNHTRVDYMVLDIEGGEMSVIQATDWTKIDVDILQVEYMVFNGAFWDKDRSAKRRDDMRHFFKKKMPQYKEHSVIFLDMIFAKKQLIGDAREIHQLNLER